MNKGKVKNFLKKNAYVITVSLCAVAIFSALVISVIAKNNSLKDLPPMDDVKQETPKKPDEAHATSNPETNVFICPISDYTGVVGYSEDRLVKNETLGEWTTHLGIDYLAPSDTKVVAAGKGKVESVEYSSLYGTMVVIDHGENIKTVYKSLSNAVLVEVGQEVNAGDEIGVVSASAGTEANLGDHLHFEVLENGVEVDPNKYLEIK